MKRIIIISAIMALAVACGGGEETASEPPGSRSDTPSTPTPSPADEPAETEAAATATEKTTPTEKAKTGQPITKQEAATFLEGLMEAMLYGKTENLPGLLSSTCSSEDRGATIVGAIQFSDLASALAGEGDVDVIVDPDKLVVEIISNNQAVIVAQPTGTTTATVDGRPLSLEENEDTEPIGLVRENGRWVTTICMGAAEGIFGGAGG